MQKKMNVLFIGGFGRSGSTLLDNVFGQVDGVFSIGELRFIWSRGLQERQLCGCQKTLYECEVWSKILNEAYGEINDDFINNMITLSQKVDKPKYILKLLLGYDKEYNETKEKYKIELLKLYKAIYKVTGSSLIVDSSKTPIHGLILNELDELNVNVLHLIRDLRAVTFSWKKKKLRPEITNTKVHMATHGNIRTAVWWTGSNIFTEILGKKSKKYFFRHYENFCQNPKSFIGEIIQSYPDLKQNKLEFINNNIVHLEQTHTVAGNPSRFKFGDIHIKMDNEWEEKMSLKDKIIVTVFGLPFLIKYGYFQK